MLILVVLIVLIVLAVCWWYDNRPPVEPPPSPPPSPLPVARRAPTPRPVAPTRRAAPGWVCALDLGTHASKAAVWAPGEEPRPVRFGSAETMPSAAGLDAQGRPLTGREALTFEETHPFAVLRNPKAKVLRREVVLQSAGTRRQVTPCELLAATLTKLHRAAAADCPPGPLREIVLTHPVAWTGTPALDVLRAAGQRAGLPDVPVTLVAEPIAAAAWVQRHHPGVTGSRSPFLVVDIGGGSLDVALLRGGPGGLEVLDQPVGRTDVGGTALDSALLAGAGELWGRRNADRWAALWSESGPPWQAARRACQDHARIAKENLTAFDATGLQLTSPYWQDDITVTRAQFELWIDEIVWAATRTVDAMRATNRLASGTPVFLSGGSSRVPVLRTRLGGLGLAVVDPESSGPAELTVVRGAALQGQVLRHALHC